MSTSYGVPAAEPLSTGYGVPNADPIGPTAGTNEDNYYDDSATYDDYENYDYPSVKENEVQPISQGYEEAISTGYGVPRAEPLGDNYQGSTASTKGPGSDNSYEDYSNVVNTGDYSYEDDYYNSGAIEVQHNLLWSFMKDALLE